jgi:DNA-binding transcriptional LysR family regulator
VEAVSVTSLAEEMDARVDQRKPDVVCISATPPAAVMHARHLCKHLRSRFPQVHLVVGLWDVQGDLNKARERIGCGAIVLATLAEAQEQVRLLIQSHLPAPERQPQPDSGPRVQKVAHL